MVTKYFKFFSQNIFLVILLVVGLVGGVTGLVLSNQAKTVKAQLNAAKAKKGLVDSILEMEDRLGLNKPSDEDVPDFVPTNEELLTGTAMSNGQGYSVVNGFVFKIGNVVGDYTIADIRLGRVTLIHNATGEAKVLSSDEE